MEKTLMHCKVIGVATRKKVSLASWAVLLGSLFGAEVALAQNNAKNNSWQSQLSVDQPEVIYRRHCAGCHGASGDGKGVPKTMFDPSPADFTSEHERADLTRAHMIEAVSKGVMTNRGKPTAMIAWKGHLSREQIEAVVDHIIVRFMDGRTASATADHSQGHQHIGHDHSAANIRAVDYPFGLKPGLPSGQAIYSTNCAKCHGDRGDGQGNPAAVGKTRPRSFLDASFQRSATGFTLFSAVFNGRGHIPAWNKPLSNQEIADVSEYVLQSFAKPR